MLYLIYLVPFYFQGASKFKKFTDSLHVHMGECSPTLQKLQHHSVICTEEDNNDETVEKRTIIKHTGQNSCVMAYYTGTDSIRMYGVTSELLSPENKQLSIVI